MLSIFKLRKVGLIITAVLVLALGVLVLREHVWPPDEAFARSSTLTALSGDNVTLNEKNIEAGKTVSVEEGDVIKTGTGSYALITFEDGSTVELEPGTEITISVLTESKISVFQQVGQTWTGVKKLATGPVSDFEINTPSAGAVVQGTIIDTFVEKIVGDIIETTYGAFEGTIEVTAEGITQLVIAGMQSIIQQGSAPEVPQPIPALKNRLEFTIDGNAWAQVVDGQQRSIGVVPPGVVVNQIPRSSTTGAQAESQSITVPTPKDAGDHTYYIALYGHEDVENVDISVTGYADSEPVFTVSENDVSLLPYDDSNNEETKYVGTFVVTIGAGELVAAGEFSQDFVPVEDHPDYDKDKDNWPGHVEIKDWAIASVGTAVPPQANFSATLKDGKINFTNLSTGDITGYAWDFGDGSTSNLMSPSHTYAEGEYSVSLTVSGVAGDEDEVPTDTMRITIYVFTLP